MKRYADKPIYVRHYPLYAGNPRDGMDHPNKSGDDALGFGLYEGSVE